MTTLADLDRTHRSIPSEAIRQMTGDRTGQFPHNRLWRDMRRIAGIQPKQRRLTQLEAMRLIAVTVTWQETGRLPQTLVQVNRVASELLTCRGIADLFTAIQERSIQGAELPDTIARMTGKRPSKATLYRWGDELRVPFSKRRSYSPNQVKRFIELAQVSAASA